MLTRGTADGVTPGDVEHAYDVRVNALSVDDLFALYERTGFLYPAKAARLAPHLEVVRDHWRRLLEAGESLLYVLTSGEDRDRAAVAVWRTTRDSWMWQHLVCERSPLRARAVMLGGLARCMRQHTGESQQNWFRPENRFPARVFGSMVPSVGESFSTVQSHAYFAVPHRTVRHPDPAVRVVPYAQAHHAALCALAARVRGPLYVTAESLDGDVDLQSVDALYRRVGLRRTRHVWLAYRTGSGGAVGAAIAYRGPLGLNFSFLENRCDLLLSPRLSDAEARSVTSALLAASMDAYAGFELRDIPVVASARSAPAITAAGGVFLRNYSQGIWLKDGQPLLYRHVDRFYARLVEETAQRDLPSARTA